MIIIIIIINSNKELLLISEFATKVWWWWCGVKKGEKQAIDRSSIAILDQFKSQSRPRHTCTA